MELIYFFVLYFPAMGWLWICMGRAHKIQMKLIQFTYDKEGRSYPEWWNYTQTKRKWFEQQLSHGKMIWEFFLLQRPQKFIKGEFAEKFLDRMDYY